MTTSAHIGLRNAMVALFLAAAPLAGGRVKPGRAKEPMVSSATEEVRVWLHDSDASRADIAGKNTAWRTQIAVHCMARSAEGLDAETRADLLAQQVLQRVAASGRLGGLALDIGPTRATWEGEALDTTVADNLLVFALTHRTPGGAF